MTQRKKTKAREILDMLEKLDDQESVESHLVKDINRKLNRVNPESFSDRKVTLRNKR